MSKNTINLSEIVDVINSTIPGDNTTTIRAKRGDRNELYNINIPIPELLRAAGISNRQLGEAYKTLAELHEKAHAALFRREKFGHIGE